MVDLSRHILWQCYQCNRVATLVGITVFTQKGHLIEKGCLLTCTKTHLEGLHLLEGLYLLEGALTGTRILNLNVKVSNIMEAWVNWHNTYKRAEGEECSGSNSQVCVTQGKRNMMIHQRQAKNANSSCKGILFPGEYYNLESYIAITWIRGSTLWLSDCKKFLF